MSATDAQLRARVRNVLRSIDQAARSTEIAFEDFVSNVDSDRRVTAIRNLAANGYSVSQMSYRLRSIPSVSDRYATWWLPLRKTLSTDPAAQYIKKLRTSLTHTDAPEISERTPFVAPEALTAVRLVLHRPGRSVQVLAAGVIGTTPDGREIWIPPAGQPITLIGSEEETGVEIEPIMRRYVELITQIAVSARTEFNNHARPLLCNPSPDKSA